VVRGWITQFSGFINRVLLYCVDITKSGDTEGADDTKVSEGAQDANLYYCLSKIAILSIFRDFSVFISNPRFIHF
jgi:hypothetical protein